MLQTTPRTPSSLLESTDGITVKTLLLTDLVDSTRMIEKLGDEHSSELWTRHDSLARELMTEHGAWEIDKADGFLLLFDRPIDAVHFALDYHRHLAELTESVGIEIQARCGIHLGEVIIRPNNAQDVARGAKPIEVEGLAKPAVARLASLAMGRQTLLTRSVFDLGRRAAASQEAIHRLRWMAHGPYRFQGVEESEDVFEVGIAEFAPLIPPPDSAKARRAVTVNEMVLGWRAAPHQPIPRRHGWMLHEKLGEGGFGEVWLALHEKTGEKRVFKFCYDRQRLQALRREVTLFRLLRETLGHRDDIARLLDWNFDDSPYYLELDYTAGGSLVTWAEQQGGLERVPLTTRIELVAQVAEALAAAHSVGVLHKDVKPGNVLVTNDAEGRPKAVLTDFGVGLVTDLEQLIDRGITQCDFEGQDNNAAETATAAGSQLYLAPELFLGGNSTVQADVYSLGVTLYQIVAGDFKRPMAQGWRRDVVDDLLAEDIAEFVDRTPERRPASALEVARRLRHLDERRKRRDGERQARVEAEKGRRRRRLLAAAAIVSSLVLVVVSFFAVQAHQARIEAERGRQQANYLIDFMLFDLRDGLETIGRLDLLEQVARGSQSYFETFDTSGESADSAFRRATSFLSISEVFLDQGDTESALTAARLARQTFEGLNARESVDPDGRAGLGKSRSMIGDALRRQGQSEAALAEYFAALELARELRSDDNPQRIFELAEAHYKVAFMQNRRGEYAEALVHGRNALKLVENLTREREDVSWRHRSLQIDVQVLIGQVLEAQDDLREAFRFYDEARRLAERLAARDPATTVWRSKLPWIQTRIGRAEEARGDFEAALESLAAAHTTYGELVARDRTRVEWLAGQGQSGITLGHLHLRRDEPARALELYQEALAIFEGLTARDETRLVWQSSIASSHEAIGSLRFTEGEAAAALESFQQGGRYRRAVAQANPSSRVQNNLSWNHVLTGNAYELLGRQERASAEWSRALEVIEPVIADDDDAVYRDTEVHALLHLDRLEEARPIVQDLLERGWNDPAFLALAREHDLLD